MRGAKSKLEFYSVAIVVKDKERNTDFIEAYPVEALPFTNGPIADAIMTQQGSMPDAHGGMETGSVERSASVQAKWLGLACGNRNSSPDVVKNESVLLYKYSDSEALWWEDMGREPGLRRREVVLYVYGNEGKFGVPLTRDNTYWLEVNCVEKHITLKTNRNDGERVAYELKLDTLNGLMTLQDDAGNSIFMDSQAGKAGMKATSSVELEAPETKFKTSLKLEGDIESTGQINALGGVLSGGQPVQTL